jgi:hypothetical protein
VSLVHLSPYLAEIGFPLGAHEVADIGKLTT